MFSDTEFKQVLENISEKKEINSYELVPFLAVEDLDERISANLQLAEAYFKTEEFKKAELLVTRAFILSGFSAEILPLYKRIFEQTKNAEALKFAYKRIGIKAFDEGEISNALTWFDKWQYAYANQLSIDRYIPDYDIQNTIDQFCGSFRSEYKFANPKPSSKKIKVGYLPVHFLDPGSVLIKLDKLFAQHHDKDVFDITYFVMETESNVQSSAYGRELDRYFQDLGCSLVYLDACTNKDEALLLFVKKIADRKPGIFITNAALANFDHYFIASFRPAPLSVAVVHGPIGQYVTNIFDHAISSFDLQSVDIPCNITQINIELGAEAYGDIAKDPCQNNCPEKDKVVLICGGRLVKFQNMKYWETLFNILKKNVHAELFVIGFAKEQFPFPELLEAESGLRISFFGWTNDYLNILRKAHIYVDGFPVGGGVFMMEAMRLGIPAVGFEHNYLELFNGDKGSGAQEIVGIEELCVEQGNFNALEQKINFLTEHNDQRNFLGRLCKEKILSERSDPQRMVKRYEEVYLKLIKEWPGNGRSAEKTIMRKVPGNSEKLKAITGYFKKLLRAGISKIRSATRVR